MTTPDTPPTSIEVNKLHQNCDVDSHQNAQHHTLGLQHNQATSGDHTHNGKNSKLIGKGIDSSFPSVASAAYSQSQIQSIIDALRALGLGT